MTASMMPRFHIFTTKFGGKDATNLDTTNLDAKIPYIYHPVWRQGCDKSWAIPYIRVYNPEVPGSIPGDSKMW